MQECFQAFVRHLPRCRNLCLCRLSRQKMDECKHNIELPYRTIAEYCRLFPGYSRPDIVRLYSLTGGIPSILKELDENESFEEHVCRLLAYDSAFSRLLPLWAGECFRSPESYYPIIQSIANGNHRLSEIARDVGFPNNKCGTYLDALIKHGFVRADKPHNAKQAAYQLTNSYLVTWGRYICGKQAVQIAKPDRIYEYMMQDMDDAIAVPAFRDACMRYLAHSPKGIPNQFRTSKPQEWKVTLKDGSTVTLDHCVVGKKESLFCIFPRTFHMRYTKDVVERIYEAIQRFTPLYDSQIYLFSLERFRNWSVHEAAAIDGLHEVTMERLKY